jgi:Fe-S-cluster containining protein
MSTTLSASPQAHVCARCHLAGGGCCRTGAEGVEYMFGLTRGEIKVMSRASGLDSPQFVVADQASPRFQEFLDSLNPLFRQTMPRGRRLRLRLGAGGDCCFLGDQGCRLPSEARPLYCRLYPIFVNPYGRLMVLASRDCLVQEGARSWREVMKRLGQDEATVRELFAKLQKFAAAHEEMER